MNTPFLPKGTVFYSCDDKLATTRVKVERLIVQEEPRVRTLSYAKFGPNDDDDGNPLREGPIKKFTLSFPYCVHMFVLTTEQGYGEYSIQHCLFFNKAPIKNEQSLIYYPWLSNINEQQRVCIGSVSEYHYTSTPINKTIDNLIAKMWNSPFNQDYRNNMTANAPRGCKSYLGWANNSKKDRMFWADAPYKGEVTIKNQWLIMGYK